ncbi:MAG: hypothetical protein JWM09_1086 [Francisellaceae bacterium]|nr:hypothetical protein [Francisellaceae bacterium]
MNTQVFTPVEIHQDLYFANIHVYKPCGFEFIKLRQETESKDYGAYNFELNNRKIKFRVAKITPTKIGQFVTLWKRINKGPIIPYDSNDKIDLFVINVRTHEHFGQFVFPKEILVNKGIVSMNGKGGKRAIRVYPSWDLAENSQAKKTQAWQLKYFFKIQTNNNVDMDHVRELYNAKIGTNHY